MTTIIDETTEVNPRPRTNRKRKEIELVVEGGETDAKVTKMIDGARVSFDATVRQNETAESETDENGESENSDLDFENEIEDEIADGPQIPKTKLEIMFEHIRYAVTHNKIEDTFYAQVIRLPDSMTSFRHPCNASMDIGMFQFTSSDYFRFKKRIQELNNNSGGFFNVRIYKLNQTPLTLYKRSGYQSTEVEVGLLNYSVSDPIIEALETVNGRSQTQDNIGNALLEFMRQTDNRFNAIMEEIRRPREKSTLENAIEQKVLNDILNPPQKSNESFEEKMMTIMAMPVMVEGLSKKMFPDTNPVEPDMFDKVGKALQIPVVQSLIERVGDISEAMIASRLAATPGAPPIYENAAPQNGTAPAIENTQETEDDDMKIFIDDLIIELEGQTPINAENAYLNRLKVDFPEIAGQVQSACKNFDFDVVTKLLVGMTDKMQPSPFVPFLDIEETQRTGAFAWNERGQKLLVRLKEFHEFARTAE